jgi:hypothetical protein
LCGLGASRRDAARHLPHWAALRRAELQRRHCQLNEKSLPDAFLVKKAEGVQTAKIEAIAKEEKTSDSFLVTALMYRFFA